MTLRRKIAHSLGAVATLGTLGGGMAALTSTADATQLPPPSAPYCYAPTMRISASGTKGSGFTVQVWDNVVIDPQPQYGLPASAWAHVAVAAYLFDSTTGVLIGDNSFTTTRQYGGYDALVVAPPKVPFNTHDTYKAYGFAENGSCSSQTTAVYPYTAVNPPTPPVGTITEGCLDTVVDLTRSGPDGLAAQIWDDVDSNVAKAGQVSSLYLFDETTGAYIGKNSNVHLHPGMNYDAYVWNGPIVQTDTYDLLGLVNWAWCQSAGQAQLTP